MNRILTSLLAAAALFCAVSCDKEDDSSTGSSTACFFSSETLTYDLQSDPAITIPVLRLGKSGDLNVTVTTSGASEFSVPSSVTIKDGERIANLEVTYNKLALVYNQEYKLTLTIGSFDSIYGYGTVECTITFPTSYSEYGSGIIEEDWWGEQEEKTLYVRDFATNVLQCYLPDCWGHDSGAGYNVQNYTFYWNTETNMLYVPIQSMGTAGSGFDWSIADRGAIDCRFNGGDFKEGSTEWMNYIDSWYTKAGFKHPYYDPDKNAFYLSDSAAINPTTGAVVYATPGSFDVFTIK